MSLKEQTKAIYKQYGLTGKEFDVYLVFLGYPQFTVSEVSGVLGLEESDEVQIIADKLEKLNFIKKIPGIVNRYIPMEPYLELFDKESSKFREEVEKIKDNILSDQSTRFSNLEKINSSSIYSIDSSVENQINKFFKDSDDQDTIKKDTIGNAKTRFDSTTTSLIDKIQGETFSARENFTETRTKYSDEVKLKTHNSRDRFEETSKQVEQNIQENLFNGRDRFESTSKELEKNLHQHIDTHDENFNNAINSRHEDTVKVLDGNSSKFTNDNNTLNSELKEISGNHNNQIKEMESNFHNLVDRLNSTVKKDSGNFKTKYSDGVHNQKNIVNKIFDDLLKDFSDRVQKLEVECKKDLDEHVEHHKESVDELKPTLDEILDKYIIRMKKIVESLKSQFSTLLTTHISEFKNSSGTLEKEMKKTIETRHSELAGQVLDFKKNTVTLIDNLEDTSDRYLELAKDLGKRGSAWKALLFGKHKKFKSRYKEIQERVGKISGTMKKNFKDSTANYILETGETTTKLKSDVENLTLNKNKEFNNQTEKLNVEQNDSLNLELQELAGELSNETEETMKKNVKHCQDTTLKLKDSIENSLHTHHEEYEFALNKHRQKDLDHNDVCNSDVKSTVNNWMNTVDEEHTKIKNESSSKVEKYVEEVTLHLEKTQQKNNLHSGDFQRDIKDAKSEQRRIFDNLIRTVGDDFRECKTEISQDIDGQINLFKTEIKKMDDFQHQKLDGQINLFKQEIDEINAKQQQQINNHINKFKEIIGNLDDQQHNDLGNQINLFTSECNKMEESLHLVLNTHKNEYKVNATKLQSELTETINTNIQDTKDAIADFTLNFMNEIDDSTEIAENTEEKLSDISNAAMQVKQLGNSLTWHVFGHKALIEAIIVAMNRVKSTITIITPSVEPKILEALSQVAYRKKSSRFLYTTSWDMATFGPIIQKMKVLGNIQFRNLKNANDFFAVSRDGEEIVLCPKSKDKKDLIAIVSEQDGYAQIFSSFIYPIFQANSRPV